MQTKLYGKPLQTKCKRNYTVNLYKRNANEIIQ